MSICPRPPERPSLTRCLFSRQVGSQRGFIGGRNFGANILELDVWSRVTGLEDDAPSRLPILVSFDYGQAFPSIARAWIFRVLASLDLPPPPLYSSRLPRGAAMGHRPQATSNPSDERCEMNINFWVVSRSWFLWPRAGQRCRPVPQLHSPADCVEYRHGTNTERKNWTIIAHHDGHHVASPDHAEHHYDPFGVHTKFGVKTQYCTVSLRFPEVHIKGAVLYPL